MSEAVILDFAAPALIVNAVAPGLGVLSLTSLHRVVDHPWLHVSSVREIVLDCQPGEILEYAPDEGAEGLKQAG